MTMKMKCRPNTWPRSQAKTNESLPLRHRKQWFSNVLLDGSDRTNPLSEDDASFHNKHCNDDLDAKRPQHLDIQTLSAEFTAVCSDQTDASMGQDSEELGEEILLALLKEDNSREVMTRTSPPALQGPQGESMPSSSCLHDTSIISLPSTKAKTVRFSTVEVQEYARCAGDNPSVTSGVPLSISWQVEAHHFPISVNDYEDHHHPKRTLSELRMGPVDRMDVLRRCGFARGELKETIQQVDLWRAQRKETVEKILGRNILNRWWRWKFKRCSRNKGHELQSLEKHSLPIVNDIPCL